MSNKLGYTWYPKDFASDPDVMLMSASERGIYRDLIDLAYITGNKIAYSIDALCRYTNGNRKEVQNILNLKGKKVGDYWKIPSCDKRIALTDRNKANGNKGGRPPKDNPEQNPNGNQSNNPDGNETETQTVKQRERENKRESEDERERETEETQTQAATTIVSLSSAEKVLDLDNDEFALLACRQTTKTREELKVLVSEFLKDQKGYGKTAWQNEPDLKKHFVNWSKKQDLEQKSEVKSTGYVIGQKPLGAVSH